jgi:hypothetical protein
MTVEVDDTVERYLIDGVGPYPFSFRIFDATDLQVTACSVATPAVPTLLVYPADYTVSDINDEDGGSITLVAGTATTYDGYTLDIRSNTPNTQTTSIRNQGRFLPEIHENAFDHLSRQIQDLRRIVQACIRYPDNVLADGTLTPLSAWTSKSLAIDENGLLIPIVLSATAVTSSVISSLLATSTVDQDAILALLMERSDTSPALVSLKRTPAEIAANVTPTNYAYSELDVRRYGVIVGSSSASVNSAAIQAASDVAYAAGGGVIELPATTSATPLTIDAVPKIWNTVSIRGRSRFGTFIKKTTTTASTISDNTVRFWDSASVGNPICCLHFVHHDGVNNWADGFVSDITVMGDTLSPNTTTTVYGFFFRGMSESMIFRCYSQYVQVGFFFGAGSCFASAIYGNVAANVQRGFYQHFMTSTSFFSNYANNWRFAGYYFSWYYCTVAANACDNGGLTWKVGTTEIALAYQANGCKGGSFRDNGCETHNGSVWSWSNCISTRFENNLGLAVTSNYTGGGDVVLEEHNGNNGCKYFDNRVNTTGMTGTGARHFMYKIATELGPYKWEGNRYVASIGDTTNTSTWANTSGTIVETQSILVTSGTYTPTVAGASVAGTTTYVNQEAFYERHNNIVTFRARLTWSGQTGTGSIVIGGLPFAAANTNDVPVTVVADSLTFSGQLVGLLAKNTTNITLFAQATGAALAGVAMDTAATLWVSGMYHV